MPDHWQDISQLQAPGHMGVFELADAAGVTLFVGVAGGRSRFGLKGEIAAAVERFADARRVRFEVTAAYLTRYQELLMRYQASHGELPAGNRAPGGIAPLVSLGRLSPA